MPKRKKAQELPDYKATVQAPLSESMQDSILTMIKTPSQVALDLIKLADEGLTITIGPDKFGGIQVSMRNSIPDHPNAGLQFYGNAPDAVGAAAVGMVKLDFLENLGDWSSATEKTSKATYR